MKIEKLLSGFLGLLFLCCHTHPETAPVKGLVDSNQKEKRIPYHEDAEIRTSQRLFLQNLGKIMGLPQIVDAKAGVNMRVWIWDTNSDTSYAVSLKLDSPANKCNIVKFYHRKVDTTQYVIIEHEWKDLEPRSGWASIHAALSKYDILTRSSGVPYEKQKRVSTTMTYVQFEVGQTNEYKYYEYLEPSYYRYVDHDSKQVYDFLEYLNEQFGVQVYNPAKKMFVEPG